MKRRVLSMALVLVMIFSLLPISAFAAGSGLSASISPEEDTVTAGGSVQFTAKVENAGVNTVKYFWFFVNPGEGVTVPANNESKTLTLSNVSSDSDGASVYCVAYTSKVISATLIKLALDRAGTDVDGAIKDINGLGIDSSKIDVSEPAILHVNSRACQSHSLDTNLVKLDAKEPTCAEEGSLGCYYCADCNRYFADAEGKQQLDKNSITLSKLTTHGSISHVDAAEGTCCERGHKEYYECDICGQKFSDAAGTKTVSTLDIQTEKVLANHTNLQHFDAVAPTCCSEGNIEYWYCDGCRDYYTDAAGTKEISQAKIDLDRDHTKHASLTEYPAVAATCKAPGNIRYYYCSDCKDYFSDAAGTSEISKSDTELKQLSHSFVWQTVNDNGVEWHEYKCTVCGTVEKTGAHSGGEAACCSRAVCDVCGHEYGTTNPDKHIHTDRIVIKEATPTQDGICNIYCNDCKQIVEKNVSFTYQESCIHDIAKVEKIDPKCESCKDAYGVKEHYECTKCGAIFSDENGEKLIANLDSLKIEPLKHKINIGINDKEIVNVELLSSEYGYNDIGHYRVCKYCGEALGDLSTHNLKNGDADCCHGATYCLVCGYTMGEKNPNNHAHYGTEVRDAVEPTDTTAGYTGDTYCRGCGALIESGHSYTKACEGGCAKTLAHHDAEPASCTEDGVKEYWECTVCHNRYLDEKATAAATDETIVDKCTGHDLHPSKATITATNITSLINTSDLNLQDIINIIKEKSQSGNISISNISIDDFLGAVDMKDIDHCYDDEYHWLGCQRCGLTLEQLKPYFEENGIYINEQWYTLGKKEAHTGGRANCKDAAICDVCGEQYGEPGEHRYKTTQVAATCTEAGYMLHVCNDCGDIYKDNFVPAKGHQFNQGNVCTVCGTRWTNPFYDVTNDDYFKTPVLWAYYHEPQITGGVENGIFDPYGTCTRAQVITFLWRYAGRPEPTGTDCSFYDVPENSYYYKAVLWGVENDVISGYDAHTFGPNDTITRGQAVSILWRFAGRPAPSSTTCSFWDVSSSAYYRTAVLWAVEKGITSGYSSYKFGPGDGCTRAQIVTFLYRYNLNVGNFTA